MEIVEVLDIKQYLKNGILTGKLKPFFAVKTAGVSARKGKVGEIINSFTLEGNYSTTKTVFRTTNGEIDWVVTNDEGESFVMDDASFKNSYEETEVLNQYRPTGKEKLVVQVFEHIQFKNKFGNTFRILPWHFVVADDNNDFYELTPKALESHYKIVKKEFNKDTDLFIFN